MASAAAAPSIYPTGTTIYDPARAWSGFTVLTLLGTKAVVVIDMTGREVKRWEGFDNAAGGPARVLPGGVVVAASGARPPHQESLALVARDFDGKPLWQFDRTEEITTREGERRWSARQHHDWQRADFPAGYYSPGVAPAALGGRTLLLTHANPTQREIADVPLEDDRLIEIDARGNVLWTWNASEHAAELGFDERAREAIRGSGANPGPRGTLDWLHINSATWLGPNRWFDAGDERFAPDNVIVSSRQASLLAIVARSGAIVWQLGPDFGRTSELRAIGQIIGQHHAHLIPRGLPGEGNLLVFDNGGSAGYGFDTPIAPDGVGAFARATSRVLEIDPVALKLVWSYAATGFYSSNISGAQRLQNGNTLITEGAPGRVFEVSSDGTIVWEYMSPYFAANPGPRATNSVYRAYRIPYGWISQLGVPEEQAVTPPALQTFRLPAQR
jgi:hypothetical protein